MANDQYLMGGPVPPPAPRGGLYDMVLYGAMFPYIWPNMLYNSFTAPTPVPMQTNSTTPAPTINLMPVDEAEASADGYNAEPYQRPQTESLETLKEMRRTYVQAWKNMLGIRDRDY